MKRNKFVSVFLLVFTLFLSSCSPLISGTFFPNSPKNDPYQINTFPISGKYIEIIGSSGHKICYYSYDLNINQQISQKQIDIIEFDFRSLEQKVIYKFETENQYFFEFEKQIIGVSYNQLEEPIFFYQTLLDGVSKVYSVLYKQKHLLYTQKSKDFPLFRGFFYKPNLRIVFNYLMLVYPQSNDKMLIVVDSIENGHLSKIETPKFSGSLIETNNHIWFFSEPTNNKHTLYCIEKQNFTLTKIAEFERGKIVGNDFADNYILINNETKNTIDIVYSTGIKGSIPCSFPQENIDFVVSKKLKNYYSLFAMLRTTIDGIGTTVPWIRYYPKNQKIKNKTINLPTEYHLYASKYYERKDDEFIAAGFSNESRTLNLIFFYFSKGLITFEPLHHRIDPNMPIQRFTYHPGYYFTWSEYTQIEKFNDYNYQVYYCSLNRLKDVVDLINKKP